ncbi:hypothetical protein BDW59DRAFT_75561 [Aspergillus cavernicola]|uniref:ARS-binding protein 1 N-terminal domain-containing protein n=1 Tax=Aspergillus cavernicola TaxID=176166 RepID=A0ABR4IBY4_9EURO
MAYLMLSERRRSLTSAQFEWVFNQGFDPSRSQVEREAIYQSLVNPIERRSCPKYHDRDASAPQTDSRSIDGQTSGQPEQVTSWEHFRVIILLLFIVTNPVIVSLSRQTLLNIN